jgi:hypothetical protein
MNKYIAILLIWVCQNFLSSEDAVQFLNELSSRRAREAKVVAGYEHGQQVWTVIYRAKPLTCGENCN